MVIDCGGERQVEIRFPRYDKTLCSADFVIADGRLKPIGPDERLRDVVPNSRSHDLFMEAHHGTMAGHFGARPSASNKAIVTTKPFEIVGVDLLEIGVTSRGNRYIVTIIDHFTNLQASALLTKVRSRELKQKSGTIATGKPTERLLST
ncbi:hypothetical protein COOONC_15171 [Cooperia oncophora]